MGPCAAVAAPGAPGAPVADANAVDEGAELELNPGDTPVGGVGWTIVIVTPAVPAVGSTSVRHCTCKKILQKYFSCFLCVNCTQNIPPQAPPWVLNPQQFEVLICCP